MSRRPRRAACRVQAVLAAAALLAGPVLTGCGTSSGPGGATSPPPPSASSSSPASSADRAAVVAAVRTAVATSLAAARHGVLAETTDADSSVGSTVARFDGATGRFAVERANGDRSVSTSEQSYLYTATDRAVRRLLGQGDDVWEAGAAGVLGPSADEELDRLFGDGVRPDRESPNGDPLGGSAERGPDGATTFVLTWGDPASTEADLETATWTVDRNGRITAWETSSPEWTTRSARMTYAPQHVDLPGPTVPQERYEAAAVAATLPGRLAQQAEEELCKRAYDEDEESRPDMTVAGLRALAREWMTGWEQVPARVRDIPGGVEIGLQNTFTGEWVVERVVIVHGKARLRWKPSQPWGGPEDQANRLPRP